MTPAFIASFHLAPSQSRWKSTASSAAYPSCPRLFNSISTLVPLCSHIRHRRLIQSVFLRAPQSFHLLYRRSTMLPARSPLSPTSTPSDSPLHSGPSSPDHSQSLCRRTLDRSDWDWTWTYLSSNNVSPPSTAPKNTPSGFNACLICVSAPTISPTQCMPEPETIASIWSAAASWAMRGWASRSERGCWMRSTGTVLLSERDLFWCVGGDS